jgi:Ca2+ transporting ATPase
VFKDQSYFISLCSVLTNAILYSDLFHPDNIKNHAEGDSHVSVSIHKLWKGYGGHEGLAKILRTDLKKGIKGDQSDMFERKKAFGLNSKRLAKTKSLMDLIIECFEDLMLRILLLAALVAGVIGVINDGWEHGWIEGASIFFAVGIIVTVTAGNNYMKEKQF